MMLVHLFGEKSDESDMFGTENVIEGGARTVYEGLQVDR